MKIDYIDNSTLRESSRLLNGVAIILALSPAFSCGKQLNQLDAGIRLSIGRVDCFIGSFDHGFISTRPATPTALKYETTLL